MQAYINTGYVEYVIFSSDLDLGPITLKLKPDLDIVKMCPHTANEVSSFIAAKVLPE